MSTKSIRLNILLTSILCLTLAYSPMLQARSIKENAQQSLGWLANKHSSWVKNNAHSHYFARVVSVWGGDSVNVIDTNGKKHKLRLAYIDAPETNQAHGMASRDALRSVLNGQKVEVIVFELDQYRREVAKIMLDGQDVNQWLLEQGHVWHYVSIAKRKQNKLDYADYAYAEAVARQVRLGLWQQRAPLAPWTFRKNQRKASE